MSKRWRMAHPRTDEGHRRPDKFTAFHTRHTRREMVVDRRLDSFALLVAPTRSHFAVRTADAPLALQNKKLVILCSLRDKTGRVPGIFPAGFDPEWNQRLLFLSDACRM
ncbi:hypothetical protein LAD77_00350 [Klebsiella pneumoniae]|nr:hypothetical protein [Klebsiella pneumoniae]